MESPQGWLFLSFLFSLLLIARAHSGPTDRTALREQRRVHLSLSVCNYSFRSKQTETPVLNLPEGQKSGPLHQQTRLVNSALDLPSTNKKKPQKQREKKKKEKETEVHRTERKTSTILITADKNLSLLLLPQ